MSLIQLRTVRETERQLLKKLAAIFVPQLRVMFSKSFVADLISESVHESPPAWHRYYSVEQGPISRSLSVLAGRDIPEDPSAIAPAKSVLLDALEVAESGELTKDQKLQVESLKANKAEYQSQLYAGIVNSLALITYNVTVGSLCHRARIDGHRESLFRLISLDKTFLTVDWVRRIIREQHAQLNTRFFNGLGEAVGTHLLTKHRREALDALAATHLWAFTAGRWKYEDFHEFLRTETPIRVPKLKTFKQRLRRCGYTRKALKATARV